MNIQTADLCDDNKDKEIQVLSSKFKNYGGLKKFSGQIVTQTIILVCFFFNEFYKNLSSHD